MMLKTVAILFFVAACAAIPLDDPKDTGDVQPPGPQAEISGDGSDLDTDSTFWGGYYRFPIHRRSYYGYRPRFYYYHSYPTYPRYWNSYW